MGEAPPCWMNVAGRCGSAQGLKSGSTSVHGPGPLEPPRRYGPTESLRRGEHNAFGCHMKPPRILHCIQPDLGPGFDLATPIDDGISNLAVPTDAHLSQNDGVLDE